MTRKRYGRREAGKLLRALIDLAAKRADDIPNKPAFIKRARRPIETLLQVPLGDVVISPAVVRKLQQADGAFVWMCLQRIKKTLRESVPMEDGLVPVGDFMVEPDGALMLPEVQLLAVPIKKAYRFEIAGDAIAMLWLQALRLVQFVGADSLHRCDCGEVFVQAGKRRFCSERCQKRVYMRRFRAGEAGKD
jgi:hypothetical protein